MIRKAWRWLRSRLVQDVPDDLAICEFECEKLHCSMGEWESCERRLRLQEKYAKYEQQQQQ